MTTYLSIIFHFHLNAHCTQFKLQICWNPVPQFPSNRPQQSFHLSNRHKLYENSAHNAHISPLNPCRVSRFRSNAHFSFADPQKYCSPAAFSLIILVLESVNHFKSLCNYVKRDKLDENNRHDCPAFSLTATHHSSKFCIASKLQEPLAPFSFLFDSVPHIYHRESALSELKLCHSNIYGRKLHS